MGINFPNFPSIGDLHPTPPQAGVPQYRWDGVAWVAQSQDQLAFVKRTGDTMSGALTLPADPAAALQAATKQYVDAKSSLYISDNPPTLPPDGSMWWDSDNGLLYIRYNDGAGPSQWVQAVATPAVDTSTFVAKAGDTMGGDLTLKGNPTVALHAAPKQYVDAGDAASVPASRFQRVSFAGVKSVDIQVPTGAMNARLNGVLWLASNTMTSLGLRLSTAAGVFIASNDYVMNGYTHYAGNTPAAIWGAPMLAGTFMSISSGANNGDIPITFDGLVSLRRPTTSKVFTGEFRSSAYTGVNGMGHGFYNTWLGIPPVGSALNVLALRIFGDPAGDVFAADSYVNVEWM
jgi:hypothetical protein